MPPLDNTFLRYLGQPQNESSARQPPTLSIHQPQRLFDNRSLRAIACDFGNNSKYVSTKNRPLSDPFLEAMAKKYPNIINAVRGRGLLLAFHLPTREMRDQFWKGAYELGLLVVRCGEKSIRLRPVLDVTDEVIEKALRLMDGECRRLVG